MLYSLSQQDRKRKPYKWVHLYYFRYMGYHIGHPKLLKDFKEQILVFEVGIETFGQSMTGIIPIIEIIYSNLNLVDDV